jgi:hypothetical protein
MAKKLEDWRGSIIVIFHRGTPATKIRELVAAEGCKLLQDFDGTHHVNVVTVTPGEDEAKVAAFQKLPEVKSAHLNDDGVAL